MSSCDLHNVRLGDMFITKVISPTDMNVIMTASVTVDINTKLLQALRRHNSKPWCYYVKRRTHYNQILIT